MITFLAWIATILFIGAFAINENVRATFLAGLSVIFKFLVVLGILIFILYVFTG